MTDWVAWFRVQLQASADSFVWAAQQLDPAYLLRLPPAPDYLGTWPPARHVWHVAEYERCLVIPSMQQWIGAPFRADVEWPDDDPAWAAAKDDSLASLLATFQQVRHEQIMLLDSPYAASLKREVWRAASPPRTLSFPHAAGLRPAA